MSHFHKVIAIAMSLEMGLCNRLGLFPLNDSNITKKWVQNPILSDIPITYHFRSVDMGH